MIPFTLRDAIEAQENWEEMRNTVLDQLLREHRVCSGLPEYRKKIKPTHKLRFKFAGWYITIEKA